MKAPLLSKIALALTTFALLSAVPLASAIPVTFSGGSNSPLSFSLAAPVSYTIIATSPDAKPFFLFQNTGNLSFGDGITSSITFSVNSGPAQTLNFAGSGLTAGVVTPNDLIFAGTFVPLNIGDVVALSAGTWTTNNPVAAAAPANGSYETFIVDDFGVLLSTNGTSGPASVPEAFSTLWLALPLLSTFAMRRRFSSQS